MTLNSSTFTEVKIRQESHEYQLGHICARASDSCLMIDYLRVTNLRIIIIIIVVVVVFYPR